MRRVFVVACLLVGLSLASEAGAAPIVLTPGDTTCTSDDPSNPNGETVLAKVKACFGAGDTPLSLFYKDNVGGSEEGSFTSSYNTVFSNTSNDPADALISYISGAAIKCPDCYLVVKDGNHKPAVYFFNLGAWNGMESLQLLGFWPKKGAISNIVIWGATANVNVPEPATLLLMGTGILGFVARRRRRT